MKKLETALLDRRLRYDGVSIIPPERVARLLLSGTAPSQLRLTHHDADTLLFNEQVEDELRVETAEPVKLGFDWRLPASYQQLDIEEHFISLGAEKILNSSYTEQQQLVAMNRISEELAEVQRRGMVELIRTVIYVLDVFREKKVIWGVGRGSSCASYLLFLAGLHAVDCVKYDVPLTEFFHD